MAATVVIVGASLGGLRTAESLRREGFDGAVVLVGEEDEPPYDRPPLSKQLLRGDWDEQRIRLRTTEELDALGLDWELGKVAVGLDVAARRLELHDGRRITYDALVIATGAAPWRPGGLDLEEVFDLRTLADARGLSEAIGAAGRAGGRVAVVGGGFIGCEVAASARHLGVEVTLIEALPAPLERAMGPEVGRYCAELHRSHGVELATGVGVAEVIARHGSLQALRLSDGRLVEASVVVVGLGVRPATSWLAGSGLRVDDGVVCDPHLSAAEGVYAVGDVARVPHRGSLRRFEHWTNASEQATLVAANLLRPPEERRRFDSVPYFWSDQYDERLQAAGVPDAGARTALLAGSTEEGRFLLGYRQGEELCAVVAGNWPRLFGAFRRLLSGSPSWADAVALAGTLVAAST